jgi:copper chaperone NosL
MKGRSDKRRFHSCSLIVIALFLPFCSSGIKPVDLNPEDMCSFCRMAISEKQFAAEIITKNGDIFKFDDIGCMLNYIKGKKLRNEIAASYVMDFEKRNWIAADHANYVATSEVQTPMGGGFLAFETRENAQSAVSRFKGHALSYSQLMQEMQP